MGLHACIGEPDTPCNFLTALQPLEESQGLPGIIAHLGAAAARPTQGSLIWALPAAGQWYHIGFHVTAAVASVPTLGLPYALSLMGWGGGLVSLVAGGAVTLFTAFLIAGMAEFGGKRHIRFRDLSAAIYGG